MAAVIVPSKCFAAPEQHSLWIADRVKMCQHQLFAVGLSGNSAGQIRGKVSFAVHAFRKGAFKYENITVTGKLNNAAAVVSIAGVDHAGSVAILQAEGNAVRGVLNRSAGNGERSEDNRLCYRFQAS